MAWLYWSDSWFYDSWNGLISSCLQKSSGHYHLFYGKGLVWCLPIILIRKTYLLLSSTLLRVLQPSAHYAQDTPCQQLLSFSLLCAWLCQATCSILRETKFSQLISLWQKVSGISLKYPPLFLRWYSDLWEVPTCLSKLLWMIVWFYSHRPFCTSSLKTECPFGWTRLTMVHQSIFHLDLFSFNPRLAGHLFLSA